MRSRDPNHVQAINVYACSITDSCISAAESTLPHTCSRQQGRRVPGWTEHVKPLKEKSLFWHRLWTDCGRPRFGTVAECMRLSRSAYHYAIRMIRKNEERIVSERIATAMLSSGRNFWEEVKRIRSHSTVSSSTVDGISDASCISKLFADKCQVMYSSVSYDGTDLQSIIDEINHKISQEATENAYRIIASHVKAAVDRLKPHKSDGCTDLTSDHLKHAGTDLFERIALLLNSVLIRGTLPENFIYSTIVPIPKGRDVNAADSNNFRGIALSSVYGNCWMTVFCSSSGMNCKVVSFSLNLRQKLAQIYVHLF